MTRRGTRRRGRKPGSQRVQPFTVRFVNGCPVLIDACGDEVVASQITVTFPHRDDPMAAPGVTVTVTIPGVEVEPSPNSRPPLKSDAPDSEEGV